MNIDPISTTTANIIYRYPAGKNMLNCFDNRIKNNMPFSHQIIDNIWMDVLIATKQALDENRTTHE